MNNDPDSVFWFSDSAVYRPCYRQWPSRRLRPWLALVVRLGTAREAGLQVARDRTHATKVARMLDAPAAMRAAQCARRLRSGRACGSRHRVMVSP